MPHDQKEEDAPPSTHSPGTRGSPVKDEDQPDEREDLASDNSADDKMAASKARDPDRPKRKKARRACAACQRAHLTCSDNRPCERCINRNIAHYCHDGARKKAKYLHDAPNEVLVPGHGAALAQLNGFHAPQNGQSQPNIDMGQPNMYAAAPAVPSAPGYQTFPQGVNTSQMPPPPPIEAQGPPIARGRQSPTPSTFNSAQPSPMQGGAPAPNPLNAQPPLNPQYPDMSNDMSMYNFDIPSMNFGNHYGALEFGMLEHITSNAGHNSVNASQQTPNATPGYGQSSYDTTNYTDQQLPRDFSLNPNNTSPWATTNSNQPVQMQNNYDSSVDDQLRGTNHGAPHAFAIGAGSSMSGASPASSGDFVTPDNSGHCPVHSPLKGQSSTHHSSHQPQHIQQTQVQAIPHSLPNLPRRKKVSDIAESKDGSGKVRNTDRPSKRPDPAAIYRNVNDPYPYTESFHKLFALLRRRFGRRNLVRIAKALASIRPSFISTTNSLVPDDLVFMERYFQRSLLEYENFTVACGTPTIVCRRTGEVAHCSKEFGYLAGWTVDVLLGKEPNLNTNIHVKRHDFSNGSGIPTAASSRGGFNTPNIPQTPVEPGMETKPVEQQGQASSGRKHQPVFLAELLDTDSVVKFYEDYAQLAFADRKGTAWSPCKVLTYRAPTSLNERDRAIEEDSKDVPVKKESSAGLANEEGMRKLSDSDGMVSCMYCWMVKRDVFNIPMVIVINFLPIM